RECPSTMICRPVVALMVMLPFIEWSLSVPGLDGSLNDSVTRSGSCADAFDGASRRASARTEACSFIVVSSILISPTTEDAHVAVERLEGEFGSPDCVLDHRPTPGAGVRSRLALERPDPVADRSPTVAEWAPSLSHAGQRR